jgi:WD40 repeat protein
MLSLVISPDSVASPVCGWEVSHAIQNNKRLIPIVRRAVNPVEILQAIGLSDRKISSVALSPDGRIAASGGLDEAIILWDVETGQPIGQPLTDHAGRVNTLIFSPDGTMLG